MSFHLLNPAWIGLLALAAVPVLVHLVARAKPPIWEFPALDLLKQVIRRTQRIKRPRDYLVLLLRTLGIIALAAAFLRPVFLGDNQLAGTAEKKTIVLVIDRSASMACVDGAQTRFGTACTRAAELLESAGSNTLANVIWLDGLPSAIFSAPSPNRDFLLETLGKATAEPQPGAIPVALNLAYEQLRGVDGTREIFVLSDFQAVAWKDVPLTPPSGIKLLTVSVTTKEVGNIALASLRAEPAEPVLGQPLDLLARVRNFSAEPRRAEILFTAGESRQTRSAEIPPWGEAEIGVNLTLNTTGAVPIQASLEEDAFPGDDVRYGVLTVKEAVRLTISADASQAAATEPLLALGQTIPWLRTQVLPLSAALAAETDLLFVHQWTGDKLTELQQRVQQGTVVMVAPQVSLPAEKIRLLLGALESATTNKLNQANSATEHTVKVVAENHPAFAIFKSGEFGSPFPTKFKQRATSSLTGIGTPLAVYEDGVPALQQGADPAMPMYFWNMDFAPATSAWSNEAAFVVFWGEWCRTMPPKRLNSSHEILPGTKPTFTATTDIPADQLIFQNASGTSPALRKLSAASWEAPAAVPGAYTWRVGSGVLEQVACNFPESESDLRTLTPSQLTAPAVVATERASMAAARDGRPLTWLCLWIALGCLGLEALVLWWTQHRTPNSKKEVAS
jgi:hypothetical protein